MVLPRERGLGIYSQGAPMTQVDAFRASSGPQYVVNAAAPSAATSRAGSAQLVPGKPLNPGLLSANSAWGRPWLRRCSA